MFYRNAKFILLIIVISFLQTLVLTFKQNGKVGCSKSWLLYTDIEKLAKIVRKKLSQNSGKFPKACTNDEKPASRKRQLKSGAE